MKKFQFSFFGMDEEYEVGKVKEKIWGMEVIKRKLVRVGSREYEEWTISNWNLSSCVVGKGKMWKVVDLEEREGMFEGLAGGAGSVFDETPNATAEKRNNKVYLCR